MLVPPMEKTVQVSVEWALLEFQSIMAAAEDEAKKTKIKAKLLHEVALEKKMDAWNRLCDAEREAEYIVQQALDDAEYIKKVARQDAQVILQRAQNEYEHMVNAFKAKVNGMIIEASVQAHQN